MKQLYKEEKFSSSGSDNSTVWMHYMATDKTHKEKARQELHKNAMSHIEQMPKATPHKTIAV